MRNPFAHRTAWNLAPNRYTEALLEHRQAGRELLDLTASNPTTIGLHYDDNKLLGALANRGSLRYDPQPRGLLSAREAVAAYYAERGCRVSPDDSGSPTSGVLPLVGVEDLILTTSTSEAYCFAFRLLCDPGDTVLVPAPSYPLFDFLADLQDVNLARYELVYDHGWQVDFHSLRMAMRAAGPRCRAVLVVHPNNPTGCYVKPHERRELNQICAANEMAIIADEVFLDYSIPDEASLTFAGNRDALTFTLSGLSKISALPQMKVAWLAVSGPEELKSAALARLEVIADTYLSMNAPIQLAVPEMLEQRHSIRQQMMQRIRTNLAEFDAQLAMQTLCHRLEVEGGWYAVLRLPVIAPDEELAIKLLQRTGVLVQPGHFYDFPGAGYAVLSLITETAIFRTGISRLLQFLATNSASAASESRES